MPFPLLRIQSGEMQSYRYTGAITAISGSLGLSSAAATQLLGYNAVFLVIRNAGPAFTIGGLPYTISQDMNVSLTGNQLSVGALISGVVLQTAASRSGDRRGLLRHFVRARRRRLFNK
jgi:hypothetical protein